MYNVRTLYVHKCEPKLYVQYMYIVRPVPAGTSNKNRPSTPITHVACESKLRSVVRSSMHPYSGNLLAIGRVVVHYSLATHTFSAGIKCQHSTEYEVSWVSFCKDDNTKVLKQMYSGC